MTEDINQLRERLSQNGYSLTRPRRLVFEALLDQEPISMHELITRLPHIDRASVYRTIEVFVTLGVVERLQIGWKYKLELSDAFHHHHHHITCTKCHHIQALPENHDLEVLLAKLSTNQDFQMTGHQIEIKGICQNCRTSQTTK